MKHQLILLHTVSSNDAPPLSLGQVADLCGAVLHAPGLRLREVEVCELSTEPLRQTRRVRGVRKQKPTGGQQP